jgi:hydroxyacylglutathione hydrolase
VHLRQFHLEGLGHASYLVGDERTGEALVLDPRRDIAAYLHEARDRGMRIAYVLDTHGHNDYLSGVSELIAGVPGVQALAPATGAYGYHHRPLAHGDVIEMGEISLEVLHTPGHTPEHVSLLVRDLSVSDEPAVLFSGGALLVHDVARPDLLGGDDATRESADAQLSTLRERILTLPDHVEVYPTHVAGSLCGGAIGSRLSTTIGYERRTNPVIARALEGRPVDEVFGLATLPAVPPYWRRMRAQNMAGPEVLGMVAEPPALTVDLFAKLREGGAVVLDTRRTEAFAGGHVPGALHVAIEGSFATWAGTVLPEGAETLLVLDRAEDLWEATWQLLRIGYAPPAGWLVGGMQGWRTTGMDVESAAQLSVRQVAEKLQDGSVRVLDVRQPDEWVQGHIEGATFMTGAEVPAEVGSLPPPDGRPLAVICGGGFRSSVIASLLVSLGREDAATVVGGMGAWRAEGLPVVRDG